MFKAVKEELLDYESFVSYIKNTISKTMGKDYDVGINHDNLPDTDILTVLKEGRNIAPNICLNAYYESYMAGTPMTEILKRLLMIYRHCSIPAIYDNYNYTLDTIKSHIFFRIVNYNRNMKILTQIPHIKFFDMAITFYCLVRSYDDSICMDKITNEHLRRWGTTVDELQKLAYDNTRKLFPPSLKTLDEVLDEYSSNNDKDDESRDNCHLYILSNEKGVYGAFYILYKDIIRDFARLINSNLYILPSSIHELILIPVKNSPEKEYLNRLIMEINETMISDDEILSDKVYIYSIEKDEITV
ncbi:hypothetical protein DFR55_10224 [Herbinix hemicellulosilytica]|uniref:Uncharacterized protein n=1 Tax=Herbinix hemicellulosilytica TaxID=1564487 RepID=A0A0H5SFM7_HERHM|nr:DUF5688 family protein [Herbinix hemicellulosilytica]RBP60233.1 hypothetical protein DFR55_10224 [Herbinix hemicellulosilytica]CRZ33626.1 hypothetical protein HHT355_0420 [Herbinix hemicellulosilytica]